jgi:tetratricopeptide (TPR) repeat protein
MAEQTPADPARFFTGVLADQHYQKGVQYEQQGDWEHALAAYRRASSLDLSRVLFLLARGRVCQAHGLEAEAEECYARALRLRPDDPVVLYNQAQLFAARGDLEAARANLSRIVDRDVDQLGERAAPIFSRLGDIALRRGDFGSAGLYFRRALAYAPGNRYAAAVEAGIERFREFGTPFAADGRVPPKVALYGYAAAVVLGMPGDDGIDVPLYPGLGFESLREVAQALARFVVVAQHVGWDFDVVAALDAESHPLAVALAAALGARAAHDPEMVSRQSRAMGVSATGSNPAALDQAVARLRERAPGAL